MSAALPWLNLWMILVSILTMETPPPSVTVNTSGTPTLLPAAIAAIVAVVVFWLGYTLNRKAVQRERQRQAIEDWLRTLSKWIDEFGLPDTAPNYHYHALTNRAVIELSLKRKNRYLAWWMHEFALAIILRRQAAGKSWASRSTCRSDIEIIYARNAEHLLAWQHGKLKSSDFHMPYKLCAQARKLGLDVTTYARAVHLLDYVSPVRMDLRRSWGYLRLLAHPEFGTPVLDSLQHFTGRKYILVLLPYLFLLLAINLVRQVRAFSEVIVRRVQLKYTERRLRRAKARMSERLGSK